MSGENRWAGRENIEKEGLRPFLYLCSEGVDGVDAGPRKETTAATPGLSSGGVDGVGEDEGELGEATRASGGGGREGNGGGAPGRRRRRARAAAEGGEERESLGRGRRGSGSPFYSRGEAVTGERTRRRAVDRGEGGSGDERGLGYGGARPGTARCRVARGEAGSGPRGTAGAAAAQETGAACRAHARAAARPGYGGERRGGERRGGARWLEEGDAGTGAGRARWAESKAPAQVGGLREAAAWRGRAGALERAGGRGKAQAGEGKKGEGAGLDGGKKRREGEKAAAQLGKEEKEKKERGKKREGKEREGKRNFAEISGKFPNSEIKPKTQIRNKTQFVD